MVCRQDKAARVEIRRVNPLVDPIAPPPPAEPTPPAAGEAAAVQAPAADGQPRYLQIAQALKRAIADGRYPVGARLPTELELCGQFQISRFTAREAVRVLSTAGLVTRRQRVGTVVIARPDEARYTHDASSVRDLFQYAQDTEMRLVYVGRIGLGKAQARDFGAQAGEEWIYGVGLRWPGSVESLVGDAAADAAAVAATRPICVTRLFLNPLLAGIEARLRDRQGPVYAMIERDFGLPIQRVEQELQAVLLDADDAANLGAAPGAPALRIVRRYYSADGRLLELAENIHPADRFSYRMQLQK